MSRIKHHDNVARGEIETAYLGYLDRPTPFYIGAAEREECIFIAIYIALLPISVPIK